MSLHNIRIFIALSKVVFSPSITHPILPSIDTSLLRPLFVVNLSVESYSVTVKFNKTSFLIICLKHYRYLFLNVNIIFLFDFIFIKTSSSLPCSVQDIFSIFLLNHVFVVSTHIFISDETDQHSLPFMENNTAYHFSSLFFISNEI